ncbi:MAG: DUF1592 domain-containing protein [Bdellovibrionales bacterium]
MRRLWAAFAVSVGFAAILGCSPLKSFNHSKSSESDGQISGKVCASQADPGNVPVHRLNKDEYNRSVQSLLGISSSPGVDLPDENTAYGFNNIAAILTVTSTSIDRYLDAAEKAVTDAFSTNSAGIFRCGGQTVNPGTLSRACAEEIVGRIAQQAFRRPLQGPERSQITSLVGSALAENQSMQEAVRWGLEWVLSTPAFLYRTVQLSTPDSKQTVENLDGYELASRLSYFLWGSQPDAELTSAAANGTLTQSAVLNAQVARMLKDPKAQSLVDSFAYQWLDLHKLDNHLVDTTIYEFSENLRADMKTETDLLLKDVILGGQSAIRLVDSKQSYMNSRLAQFYGLSGPSNNTNFLKVDWSNTERRGLLGQGSVLINTSLSNRTSVVRRGKWILDNILCEPPPPPPPNVEGLPGDPGGSLKEQMAAHRANPVCASCHTKMDPLGFALEGLDANGKWRTSYRDGTAIDSTGVLPDGRPVAGALDLSNILANDSRFRVCVTKKLMTYALGRGIESQDLCTVERLAQENVGPDKPFEELIKGVVLSDPFRKQRGGGQ